jgi:hypothetical protein
MARKAKNHKESPLTDKNSRGNVQASGDIVYGDKIGGSKNIIGRVSGNARVNIGNIDRSDNQDLEEKFQNIYKAIESRPEDPLVEKEEITQTVQRIEKETAKKEEAEPAKIERWLGTLAKVAPDILDIVVAVLTNPALGITTALRKIASNYREQSSP